MATRASTPDVHKACKNIQYRKDLRIEELETENDVLRQRLGTDVATVDSQVASKYGDLKSNYTKLYDRYQSLRQQLRDCEKWAREVKQHADQSYEKYKLYQSKHAKYKQAVREWQLYYDACKRSQADGIHEHHDVFSNQVGQIDFPSRSPLAEDLTAFAATNYTTTRHDYPHNATALRSSSLPPDIPRPRVESEQSTQGGSDATECPSSPPVKQEPGSDDAPVVISARCVKRKRSDSEHIMPPPTRIKREHSSPDENIHHASALGGTVTDRCALSRHQTSDLDALADKLATPRKTKSRRLLHTEEVSQPRPVVTSSTVIPGAHGLAFVKTEHENAHAQSKNPRLRANLADVSHTRDGNEQVLKNLDVNAMTRRRGVSRPLLNMPNKSFDEAADRIHMLSEDGEDERNKVVPPVKDNGGSQQLRLNTMLEIPSPEHQILARRIPPGSPAHGGETMDICQDAEIATKHTLLPAPPRSSTLLPNKKSRRNLLTPDSDTPDIMPHQQHSPWSNLKQRHRSHGIEKSPPHVETEDEPLRCRPVTTLRLEDFRINAKYMGFEYAWADTLRGRDQRRCLPGCTKPECCGGAFMNFADMGASSRSDQTDAQVLEAYLGPTWRELMSAHPPERKAQILTQAHAASLANQFGKHRQAFERRSTPPGFWRTDMPSTQEAEQDRAKAHEMVREKVEERRREAMREGGRWLFRDE